MAGNLGELVVFLSANADKLREEMNSAKSTVAAAAKDMSARTVKAGANITKVMVGIGKSAGSMALAMTKSTGQSATAILNLSNAAQVGEKEFQRYTAAAAQVGVRGDELSRMFRRLNRATGEDGPSALQRLVNEAQAAGKSQAEIAAEMENLERRSSRLLPLLLNNGKLLKELGDHAERTGQIMDTSMLETMDLANRQMQAWQDEIAGAKDSIAMGLWPELENLVGIFRHYVDDGAAVEGITQSIAGGMKILGVVVAGLGGAINAVGTSIGAIAAAVVQLFEGDFKGALNTAKEGFSDVVSIVKASVDAMGDVWDGKRYEDANKETLQRVQADVLEFNRATGDGLRGQNAETIKALEELREQALGIGLTDVQALEAGFEAEHSVLREALEKQAITREEFDERAKQLEKEHSVAILDLRRAVLDFAATEEEILEQQYNDRAERLNEALAQELITHEEHQAAMLAAEQQYQEALTSIEKAGQRARLSGIQTALGQGESLMNSSSKSMFEIGKAAAIANATIDTYQGIGKAWALGPILGPPMAALVAAAGFANVANIAKQKIGGGSSAAPSAPSAAAPEPQAAATGGREMVQNVYLHGIDSSQLYDGAQILSALNTQLEDGGRIVGVM